LFSATFPDHVEMFTSKFAPSVNKTELQKEELPIVMIQQFYMYCGDEEHKYDILVSLYSLFTIGQNIVFCEVYILE
jgi:ATP-dependent RNA helicase DDX19/DBP5